MEKKRGFKEWFTSSQVLLGMILVQIFLIGLQLLSRIILVRGFFIFSLIVYRHLVAAICVAPFAFYFERMVLAQGLFYYGLRDTSATYSVNFLNLVPISTFFTSIIFRWEKLGLHTWAGRAKCGGAIFNSRRNSRYLHRFQKSCLEIRVEFTIGHYIVLGSTSYSCYIQPTILGNYNQRTKLSPNVQSPRLLGMILIMVGLYSFLWGKNNETKRMVQQPIVSTAEVSNVTDLSTGAESVATIVPNSSPTNSVILELEKSDKN
ncbi:hypothetical protein JHK87_004906 [Glycine soja]|nr:hypothetical protein JHK87_004906 [Glycine soja]